ncbi:MAG: hypothetical protein Q4B10_02415 [Actinomycetaceae bacterium]|nr:hypothetical protein [Actinomycetaceae bacterium]
MKTIRIGRGKLAVVSRLVAAVCALTVTPVGANAFGETERGQGGSPCEQYLTQAGVIEGDRTPDGDAITPTTGPDGKSTPVILVHGWTGEAKHTSHRPQDGASRFSMYVDRVADGAGGYTLPDKDVSSSFVGMIEQIPGAVPFMFDYEAVNTHWVSDPHIGRKLAQGIECVTKHYGTKAIVVGHSMGGLATREALAQTGEDGKRIADRVAHVITFGTPNEGSAVLKLGYDAIDTSLWVPGVNIVTGITKLVLRHCAEVTDLTGKDCLGMAGALYSEGARAMEPGSAQLAALPPFPAGVAYTALAGDIQIGGVSLFGFNSKRLVDIGDIAVPHASALAGSTDRMTASCEYAIAAIGSHRHRVSLAQRLEGMRPTHQFTPRVRDHEIASPCFHNNLMSEVGLVTKALGVISEVASRPTSVTDAADKETIDAAL